MQNTVLKCNGGTEQNDDNYKVQRNLRSFAGLGKSDFNSEVTVVPTLTLCSFHYGNPLGLSKSDLNGEGTLLVR